MYLSRRGGTGFLRDETGIIFTSSFPALGSTIEEASSCAHTQTLKAEGIEEGAGGMIYDGDGCVVLESIF